MASRTEAQEEFDNLFQPKANAGGDVHAEDRLAKEEDSEEDEETSHNKQQVDEAMRMPVFERAGGRGLRLPDKSFDNGGRTGVKGVIADARSYEEARRAGRAKASSTITSRNNNNGASKSHGQSAINRQSTFFSQSDSEDDETDKILSLDDDDDEEFLSQWRESRKLEIAREVGSGNDIRNRRTSPSVRRYGRFDEVDMLGYLDAIEKVGRDTVVVVLVYDSECAVSQIIETAIAPLVSQYTSIHFVKVHYDQIEFDNAGVPAVLAYRNQGDLFANLTYIIDQIPDDTNFDTKAVRAVFQKHHILPV